MYEVKQAMTPFARLDMILFAQRGATGSYDEARIKPGYKVGTPMIIRKLALLILTVALWVPAGHPASAYFTNATSDAQVSPSA